jgi:HSP20 family protein
MAERHTSVTPATPSREEKGIARRWPGAWSESPFRAFQRMADEMDRMFDDFGFGRRWRDQPSWSGSTASSAWAPEVDVFQKNDQLVIKADLPGLSKDDVKVDITEDAVTIQGERRSEHEEEREGFYQSERTYGSFYRTIPLPTGAMADQAKATFRDGVLEVTMPSPPAATRGRRLEISEGAKK